jgi:hypothetical protein
MCIPDPAIAPRKKPGPKPKYRTEEERLSVKTAKSKIWRANNPKLIAYYNKRWMKKHGPRRYSEEFNRCHREYTKDRQDRCRKWINDYKVSAGCIDCGYNKHPSALHFDHITGEKAFNISEVRTLKRVMTEIPKCVVRCANCHMERTFPQHSRVCIQNKSVDWAI